MILEFVLVGVVTLLVYIYYNQTFSTKARMINKFPGPRPIPVFGNILDVQGSTERIFQIFRESAIEFKESSRAWNMHMPVINIVTAEDAEIILTSNTQLDKSIIYDLLHKWLGTGLLTSTGSKWQRRRKLLTPAFHFNILRRFVEVFGEHSMKVVAELKQESGNSKTNIIPYITNITLQTICETAMGATLDPNNKTQKDYLKSIYEIAPLTVYRTARPWLYSNFIFDLLPAGWRYNKLVEVLHKFTSSVIKDREADFKDSDLLNLEQDTEEDGTRKKKLAMLDLLISAKNKHEIDDDGIREEVDTFMFEGHDTTSTGIAFALKLFSQHKDIQERVFSELHQIFGDSDRTASYEDLQNMPYLEMCLKESLRIYPSVPLIGRYVSEDLKLTKHTVPAGTYINIHIFDLHRDSNVFPDPEKFDPDRFLPENVKGRHPFAYVPFSAGPRNCIGQKFAMFEMKSIISAILRNYVLEPVEEEKMRFVLDFVLRVDGEINVKLQPRLK